MKKVLKLNYFLIMCIFCFLTILEIINYLNIDSNLLGVIYLFFNFFISFVLFTLTYNYETGDLNIRISKIVLIVVIGLFSSFILSFLIPVILNYNDQSFLFSDNVFLISKIFKPIVYLLLVVMLMFEVKFKRKLK